MVGASPSAKRVALTRRPVRVVIPLSRNAKKGRAAGKNARPRTTLTLRHVTGTGEHGVVFGVSARGGGRRDRLGTLSLFGAQPGEHHGSAHGSGDVSFDISRVVAAAGSNAVTVTFEPINVSGDGLPAGALATIDRLVITVQAAGKKRSKKTRKQRRKARQARKARRQRQARPQRAPRPGGAGRKRTVNPKRKARPTAANGRLGAGTATPAQAVNVPGNKSSLTLEAPTTGTGAGDSVAANHAHH